GRGHSELKFYSLQHRIDRCGTDYEERDWLTVHPAWRAYHGVSEREVISSDLGVSVPLDPRGCIALAKNGRIWRSSTHRQISPPTLMGSAVDNFGAPSQVAIPRGDLTGDRDSGYEQRDTEVSAGAL